MRLRLGFLLLAFAGTCFAQDTNFSTGPQYLVTNGSPLFNQSIATPSLTFSSAIHDPYVTQSELASSLITSAVKAPASVDVYMGDVMWGMHPPSEILAHRVDTPSLTADQTAYFVYATATYTETPQPQPPTVPVATELNPMVIEITSPALPVNLPASIFDPGVTAFANAPSLLARGYGLSLGEVARYWKSHKHQAPRVLTNQDVPRK
ncbi:MAG TPA: hypothetical protein VGS27_35700 [Candidatus Sulfotelmatobacter sp.]|nr:hypothetical protein [Candidatus Sulfotelmatobacter sp.]